MYVNMSPVAEASNEVIRIQKYRLNKYNQHDRRFIYNVSRMRTAYLYLHNVVFITQPFSSLS